MARDILLVNNHGTNHFNLVLTPAQQANYTFTRVDEPPDSIADLVVVIGPDDNGERVSVDIGRKLVTARNAGVDIIITHSNPGTHVAPLPDDTPESYAQRQATYLNWLSENFGFVGVQDGYQYKMYTQVETTPTNPFGALPSTFNVQQTHNIGWLLSDAWNIIAVDPTGQPDRTNYYLALLSEAGKGRVLYWNIGHCGFGQGTISGFTATEKAILVYLLG